MIVGALDRIFRGRRGGQDRPLAAQIAALFASSEQGLWYDPSDLSTMYQDASGATRVYAPGQGQVDPPVGLMLDKRKGLVRGSEMLLNGSFDSGAANWVVLNTDATHVATFSGGTLRFQADTLTPALQVQQVGVMTVGRWYEITVVVSAYVSGSIKTDAVQAGGGGFAIAGGAGTYRTIGVAVSSVFSFTRGTANVDLTIDSISVRELQGNHAFQTTTASRPTLSARYNVFLASEAFDNSYWSFTSNFSIAKTNEVSDPSGGADAWKIVSTSGTAALSKSISTAGLRAPVFTLWAKSGTFVPTILVRNATTATNLISGSASGTDTSGAYGRFTNTDLGNGWRRMRIEVTSGISVTDNLIFYVGSTGAVPVGQYFYAWKTDLREAGDGIGLSEYQRVVDASTYDSAGFPLYLRFDGIDDFMQTASVDFSGTDKIMLSAAMRRLSDSGLGVVLELTTAYSSFNGAFALFAPGSSGIPSVGFNATGTVVTGGLSYTTAAAPVGLIATAYADIAAATRVLRINGVQVASSSASIGTGNLSNAVLYLGRRAGSSLPFNGRLYGLLLRGTAANDGMFFKVDRYLNQKAKVF